jgi:hypothetical protein
VASPNPIEAAASERARFIRDQIPPGGLFAGLQWHISPDPFQLDDAIVKEIESLGRVLLQFNRAVNLLYRLSVAGKQPDWIARWLEQGKPSELIELQRSLEFKNELPRVIRPDLLLTEAGVRITELDSVPGGIGLTGWLNQTYSRLSPDVIGGPDGMVRGFENLFGRADQVHIVVSEESATYRPEMEWLCAQLNQAHSAGSKDSSMPDGEKRFHVRDGRFNRFDKNQAVYRFFELFDVANVDNAKTIFALAREKCLRVTPPPKTFFEEKMLFALLWNRNLRGFWRQELGESFLQRLLKLVPYSWIVDPAPLPPHGAIPELNLTDWHQLKGLSQRERELILKVSGFSEKAWGARGVYLGSDLSSAEWSEAVDLALRCFERSPFVLQRFFWPKLVQSSWFDFDRGQLISMPGRVRLCPYFFVIGEAEAARAHLGGVLATICPADKKIIHGMKDSILAPCSFGAEIRGKPVE